MNKLKILNSKEVKRISSLVESQWGVKLSKDKAYLLSEKNRLYMINKELSLLDDTIRMDSVGLYFATVTNNQVRLSIEGSQIIGKSANKNIVQINEEQFSLWLKGDDLEIDNKLSGSQIVKFKNDFCGCGIAKNGLLLNHVPKERRI